MSLLDFARGPAIDAALAIFCLGLLWRLTSLLLLPRAKDNSVPKAGAPGAVPAAFRGFMGGAEAAPVNWRDAHSYLQERRRKERGEAQNLGPH